MNSFQFQKQEPRSLRHRVAEEIRKAIFTRQIKSGDRLREQDVAEQMNISRGPVREAFSLLEREGLVVTHPYKETVVANLTGEELLELLLPIRYTLESFAVKKALPELTATDFHFLESLVQDIDYYADRGALHELVEGDMAFHRFIIQKSQQSTVLTLWETIDMRIRLHFVEHGVEYADLHDITREHKDLVDALKTGNVEIALRALRRHIYELNTAPTE